MKYDLEIWILRMLSCAYRLSPPGWETLSRTGVNRSENWTKLLRDINVKNYFTFIQLGKFDELIYFNVYTESLQFFASFESVLILKYCYRFSQYFLSLLAWNMNFCDMF